MAFGAVVSHVVGSPDFGGGSEQWAAAASAASVLSFD